MLADPLNVSQTAPTAGTGSEVAYNVVKRGDREAHRLKAGATLTDPTWIVVKHSSSGSGKNGGTIVDRHLIQGSIVEHDALGVEHVQTVNLTLIVPRVSIFSEAEIGYNLNRVVNTILGSGNLTAILQGQS